MRKLLLAILAFAIVSCGKGNEEPQPFNPEITVDGRYGSTVQKYVEDYQAMTDVQCKTNGERFVRVGDKTCLVLAGIKGGHPWFQLLDVVGDRLYTEWTSIKTLSPSFEVYLGYGESANVTLCEIFPVFFQETDKGAIVTWYAYEGEPRTMHPTVQLGYLEFKYNEKMLSQELTVLNKNQKPALFLNGCAFIDGTCYELNGDVLYTIPDELRLYIESEDPDYVNARGFVSKEDIVFCHLYNGNDGSQFSVERISLKTGERLWTRSSNKGEKYNEPKVQYIVYQVDDVQWMFKCTITLYDGTKHNIDARIKVDTGEIMECSNW